MTIDPNSVLGSKLGPWKVIRILGSGGFKEVFLLQNGERQEALKITRYFDHTGSGGIEPEELETMLRSRTERECNLLARFGGGCVVSLGSFGYEELISDGRKYGVYSEEYLPGKTLDKLIAEAKSIGNRSNSSMVKLIFATGIQVIERIWGEKIVHRDIKPQNIMSTEQSERPIVFFDLGIAFERPGASLTAQPLGPGTLRYRAPETLDPDYRASIDFRSDLFSLAATVYEFAVGFHPIHHGSMSDGETVYRLLKRNAEPLFNHRADLGEQFCLLIDNCLHKRPALRPIRINDIKRMLEV